MKTCQTCAHYNGYLCQQERFAGVVTNPLTPLCQETTWVLSTEAALAEFVVNTDSKRYKNGIRNPEDL